MFSTPFLLLSRPPSVSPLSFCTLSNERRRVRKVKVQQEDKPLFARKRNQPARGFSPCISEAGECNVGRFPVLPSQSLQECVVRSTSGESGCVGSCVLATVSLRKTPRGLE